MAGYGHVSPISDIERRICRIRLTARAGRDRKSTRLNFSHANISYAVFCLKKKVDSASIEVNRHARRAKTDRLDGDKLLAMLLRHRTGERVWSVLHEPTPEDEDARRSHRELARLTQERTAHTNRIGSLLVLHNLRPHLIIGGRDWGRDRK